MNILHVIAGLDARTGGPATALVGLATAQSQAGLRVAVIAGSRRGDDPSPAESLRAQGVRVDVIGPVSGPLARHPAIAGILQKRIAGVDVVHIHSLWEEIQHQAAKSARKAAIPYIFRPCGMLDPWSLRQSRWKKKLYLAWRLRRDINAAAAIHFTADIERDLTQPLGLKAPSIVEPNGVDLREFENPPTPGSFRDRYPISKGRKLVLFMSRLHHKKGLDKLIPAFARLRDRSAVLAIAGPDPDGYQKIVEKMIADARIEDRVFFTGMLWREQRVAALADSDLFVLPSYQENFGVVVIEALAAGTPVVISDQVNLYPDILAAQVGGVTPMDIDRLATEMDRWLGNDEMRKATTIKAKEFARERYDWRNIADRWRGHYERIADRAMKDGLTRFSR
ncbi:MAG TPA: glycosyltransferase [Tepidisphaeraceae bacterium]|jgi:glycosyltransferase involved in cell wall biosynthesis|nr:glycosyltransferase [Tepidisphaeraceae bacterium]